MFGAVLVQMLAQSMEIMDKMDIFLPDLVYCRQGKAPNRSCGHNEHPMNLPYKEEVVGSSPIAPTQKPPPVGVFGFKNPHTGV